jgi:hypothetical protein
MPWNRLLAGSLIRALMMLENSSFEAASRKDAHPLTFSMGQNRDRNLIMLQVCRSNQNAVKSFVVPYPAR